MLPNVVARARPISKMALKWRRGFLPSTASGFTENSSQFASVTPLEVSYIQASSGVPESKSYQQCTYLRIYQPALFSSAFAGQEDSAVLEELTLVVFELQCGWVEKVRDNLGVLSVVFHPVVFHHACSIQADLGSNDLTSLGKKSLHHQRRIHPFMMLWQQNNKFLVLYSFTNVQTYKQVYRPWLQFKERGAKRAPPAALPWCSVS